MNEHVRQAGADPFPELAGKNVIVFDGVCVLCSGFMHFVLRHDQAKTFYFVIAQSPLGEALYRHFGLKHNDYDTNLVLLDGVLYQKLDAFLAVMRLLGWPWRAFSVLGLLPNGLKGWLYDRIARNRYTLFGRRDSCLVPSDDLKARFIGRHDVEPSKQANVPV